MSIRVAVLHGGPSSEYDVSLETGKNVLANLPAGFRGVDVFIDKSGLWHISGTPVLPQKVTEVADIVFIAMHGEYGEDGKVQQILDDLKISYNGSGAFPSALAMHKHHAKKAMNRMGLKTPFGVIVERDEGIDGASEKIFKAVSGPWILKPPNLGSSHGVMFAKSRNDLPLVLTILFNSYDTILAEEALAGREASVGVVEGFRGKEYYALLPVEIVKDGYVFDVEMKYNESGGHEISPGRFTLEENRKLEAAAIVAHQALGLRHYSRADVILHPSGSVYVMEVNSLPGLTPASIFPKALASVGSNLTDFLRHVIPLSTE